MKKIIVVVSDGCVESVFTNGEGDFELEIVDLDGNFTFNEFRELLEYVDECRKTMKEI